MKHLTICIILISLLAACTFKNEKDIIDRHSSTKQYTCPMHPAVIANAPGQCPVCGMDLVLKGETPAANNLELMLTDTQIKLANVTTQKVSVGSISQIIPINARLAINEDFTEFVSARAAGRIEKLYFKEGGREVRKGEALYELYSENLLTLQKEYLMARTQYNQLGGELRYKSFYEAAEKKLLLYGLSKEQVSRLNEQNLKDRITFPSPVSGIIKEIKVNEGNYVAEGSLLYRIENNSQLWVEGELYAKEADYLKRGDKILVQTNAESSLEATITFISPELRAGTQVMIVRATLPNPTLLLKPGQSAQIIIGHSARQLITIPANAVIRAGRGAHVFVQTDHNTFAPRVVKTGIENFDSIEITEGLKTGETVVATGAYLLYSELVLKKGMDPMMSTSSTHIH